MTKAAAKKKASTSTAVQTITPTPLDMLNRAMERGVSAEELDKFIELHSKFEANEVRKAFNVAKADFNKEQVQVLKDKINKQYGSSYSSLSNLVETVNAAMAPYGLNARWEFDQQDRISVTCILSHSLGHSEKVTLSGPPDESGSKNALQQIKSTITYLEIATYQAVTGVVAKDANLDDDGAGAGKPIEIVTKAQATKLTKLLKDSGRDTDTFLEWAGCETIEETPVPKFEEIVPMLQKAIKRAEKDGK